MSSWILFIAILIPTQPATDDAADTASEQPMRYRGVERLLAKFDAEDRADAPQTPTVD